MSSFNASGQSATLRMGVTPWSDSTPPMRSSEPSVQLATSTRLPARLQRLQVIGGRLEHIEIAAWCFRSGAKSRPWWPPASTLFVLFRRLEGRKFAHQMFFASAAFQSASVRYKRVRLQRLIRRPP